MFMALIRVWFHMRIFVPKFIKYIHEICTSMYMSVIPLGNGLKNIHNY